MMQLKSRYSKCMWIAAHAKNSIIIRLITIKRMNVSQPQSSLLAFYYLRSDCQQTTTKKARYDAICVQECPNFNIWGYGLRGKRFEGSRLYSKIVLGLQVTKRRGSGLHGKTFQSSRAPFLLINIYAPKKSVKQSSFFQTLSEFISDEEYQVTN